MYWLSHFCFEGNELLWINFWAFCSLSYNNNNMYVSPPFIFPNHHKRVKHRGRDRIRGEALWNKLSFCMKHGSHHDIIKRTNGNRVFYYYFLWWRPWAEEEEERVFVRANEFGGEHKTFHNVSLWTCGFSIRPCHFKHGAIYLMLDLFGVVSVSFLLLHVVQIRYIYTEQMFSAFNFLLCSPAQHPLYSRTWKHLTLFRNTAVLLSSYFSTVFFALCLIPYLYSWTLRNTITVFYKGFTQLNR